MGCTCDVVLLFTLKEAPYVKQVIINQEALLAPLIQIYRFSLWFALHFGTVAQESLYDLPITRTEVWYAPPFPRYGSVDGRFKQR